MKRLLPLMQREWLQHRFGWAMLALVPLALALLLLTFGHVHFGDGPDDPSGEIFPTLLAMGAIVGSTAVIFLILWASSGIIVSGLARRDLADRSIEFWLSVPVSHSESLAAPLLVHLLLVPAAALLVGLVGGYAISLVLVGRVAGVAAWLALPWGTIVAGSLAVVGRLLLGLPMATLWLSPLILLVVLMTAWFRRWGWVVLAVGLGLGSLILKQLFGQPLLNDLTNSLLHHAATALFSASHTGFGAPDGNPLHVTDSLQALPSWLLEDLGVALRDLATPLLAGALAVAAACFALLVQWRQRGAGAAG